MDQAGQPTASTIKTIYITRHAQSDPALPGQRDFDRPLGPRGLHDAPMMARRFAERNVPLDAMITSPANRTRTTAHAFAQVMGNIPVEQVRDLYGADVNTLMSVLNALPDKLGSVMLVGHNPGVSELAEHLAAGGPGHFPPCTTACILLHVEHWADVRAGSGTLAWWDSPKGH
ncbi:MAG: histidine phosphatase family protein [Bacteroidetes bacterium]|nr:histidine phosphatase family protein [Bacteroidota bacterium]